jgi:hypothetical protein
MRNVMHSLCEPQPSGSGTTGGIITERNYPTSSRSGIPEPADRKLQLIDFIQQALQHRLGTRNALKVRPARDRNAFPIGQQFKLMS